MRRGVDRVRSRRNLRALRDWDRCFPGFGHETHGVEVDGGEHHLRCLTQPTH
jgi:hypothetical protein